MRDETAKAFVALRVEGHQEIYHVVIEGRDFLFRPLTFDEYQMVCDLEKHLDAQFINDTIIRLCAMYTDYDQGVENFLDITKAFYPDKFAEVILLKSGFQNKNLYLEMVMQKRSEATQLDSIMQTYVCATFNVKPDEYERYTMEKQVKLFTMAEAAIGAEVDVVNIMNGSTNVEQEQSMPPVPEGMESIDFLNDPNVADLPEF